MLLDRCGFDGAMPPRPFATPFRTFSVVRCRMRRDPQPPETDRRDGPTDPEGSPVEFRIRLTSLTDVAAILAAIGGCLYFFNRAYGAVFLQHFGLGVGVVPMSMQDAVVDGLEGFTLNIVYMWAPILAIVCVYCVAATILRFLGADEMRRSRRARPTETDADGNDGRWRAAMRRVRSDPLNPLRLTAVAITIGTPIAIIVGVCLIAVPAELAATRDVRDLEKSVADGCRRCATYVVKSKPLSGRPIGSTPDRLFVLSPNGIVTPIRIDDITSIRFSGSGDRTLQRNDG